MLEGPVGTALIVCQVQTKWENCVRPRIQAPNVCRKKQQMGICEILWGLGATLEVRVESYVAPPAVSATSQTVYECGGIADDRHPLFLTECHDYFCKSI